MPGEATQRLRARRQLLDEGEGEASVFAGLIGGEVGTPRSRTLMAQVARTARASMRQV
jgi:hypothetical protein